MFLMLAAASPTTQAQSAATLHVAPSGRATTAVELTYPRAPAITAMPGMAAAMTESLGTIPRKGDSAVPPESTPERSAKPLVISIDYGQPHLRGRTLHTDSLVPYDKPWRTGASESTTLTTDVDLLLGGTKLPRGKYILYTIPSRGTWKLIVQKSIGQSAMTYDAANDFARLDLRLMPVAVPLESFTMWLVPSLAVGSPHGELRFAWGVEQLSVGWSVTGAPASSPAP